MKQNKIHNLNTLLEEKYRLSLAVIREEQDIKNQVNFFQTNYKNIIWEKINPFKGKESLNQIAGLLFSDILPAVIAGGTQSSTGMLLGKGVRLVMEKGSDFLLKKLEKRKENKKNKPKKSE